MEQKDSYGKIVNIADTESAGGHGITIADWLLSICSVKIASASALV